MTENLNPEIQEAKPRLVYSEQAKDILAYVADEQSEGDQKIVATRLNDLFESIYESAEKGDLVSRRGDAYTPDGITDQLSAFRQELSRPEDERSANFSSLIPSQGGMRSAFLELSSNPSTKLAFKEALDLKLWLLKNEHEEVEKEELREPDKLKEIGHEGTEAAGINEPVPDASSERGVEDDAPTREAPYIFSDGIQRPYQFSVAEMDGTGNAVGYYYEKDKVILLIDPNAETRTQYSFGGNYIKVDAENANGFVMKESTPDESLTLDAAKRILGDNTPPAEVQQAEEPQATQEKIAMTADEYLNKLTEGLSEADVRALQDYSVTSGAERRTRSIGEFDNAAHWGREKAKALASMSSDAKAIADKYTHADMHYR